MAWSAFVELGPSERNRRCIVLPSCGCLHRRRLAGVLRVKPLSQKGGLKCPLLLPHLAWSVGPVQPGRGGWRVQHCRAGCRGPLPWMNDRPTSAMLPASCSDLASVSGCQSLCCIDLIRPLKHQRLPPRPNPLSSDPDTSAALLSCALLYRSARAVAPHLMQQHPNPRERIMPLPGLDLRPWLSCLAGVLYYAPAL